MLLPPACRSMPSFSPCIRQPLEPQPRLPAEHIDAGGQALAGASDRTEIEVDFPIPRTAVCRD